MGIAKRKWPAGAALACALVCVASTSDASEPAKKPPPRLWGRQEVSGPAPPLISSLLADPDWAEDVLFRGELHYKEPGVPDVRSSASAATSSSSSAWASWGRTARSSTGCSRHGT